MTAYIEKETIAFLNQYQKEWLHWLQEFGPDSKINTLMAKADLETYKLQKAKLELDNNGTKRLLVTGCFWLVSMLSIFYTIFLMASSTISIYRLVLVFFTGPILMTIMGAFVLRSIGVLKEENFMKLVQLTLRINFKGLKSLGNGNQN